MQNNTCEIPMSRHTRPLSLIWCGLCRELLAAEYRVELEHESHNDGPSRPTLVVRIVLRERRGHERETIDRMDLGSMSTVSPLSAQTCSRQMLICRQRFKPVRKVHQQEQAFGRNLPPPPMVQGISWGGQADAR